MMIGVHGREAILWGFCRRARHYWRLHRPWTSAWRHEDSSICLLRPTASLQDYLLPNFDNFKTCCEPWTMIRSRCANIIMLQRLSADNVGIIGPLHCRSQSETWMIWAIMLVIGPVISLYTRRAERSLALPCARCVGVIAAYSAPARS